MTKVLRLTGINVPSSSRLTPKAVNRAVGVGRWRVVEALVAGELCLLVHRVGADAHPRCADGGEFGGQVPEVARLHVSVVCAE
jgi:hypothetical protein